MHDRFRLVTRGDTDGLVCAVLLKDLDLVDEILFANPGEMQNGHVEITNRDITTNLPYVEDAYLVFDHHSSETTRNPDRSINYIIDPSAPSTARLVYDHYGGAARFPGIPAEMLEAVDKVDAAAYTLDDVVEPKGWELLSFVLDERTGLERFPHFTFSREELGRELVDLLPGHTIDEILDHPMVKERVAFYFAHQLDFKDQIERCSTAYRHLLVVDVRWADPIWPGNRFLHYALHPSCSVSIHVLPNEDGTGTVFSVGKSIFNRSCVTNVGELMLRHGGGGHANVGACRADNGAAEGVLSELIDFIVASG